jgi:hypothetical protein
MGNVYGVGSSEEGAWVSSEDPPPTVALAAAAVVVVVVSCIRVAAAAGNCPCLGLYFALCGVLIISLPSKGCKQGFCILTRFDSEKP